MNTYYKINDFNTREKIKPITGNSQAIITNYTALDSSGNPQDLNEIFAPISADLAFKTTNANTVKQYTIKNSIKTNYYLVIFTDTVNQGSIEFTSQSSVTVNYLIVGGGGGGGYSSVIGGAGAGGGGGSIQESSVTISPSTKITIMVGEGGNGGSFDGTTGISPTSGSPSSISYDSTTFSASGGIYGESVIVSTPANGGNSSFNLIDASGGLGVVGSVKGVSVQIPGGGAGPKNTGENGNPIPATNYVYNSYVFSSGNGGDGYTAINFDLNAYGGGGGGGGSLYKSMGNQYNGISYGTGGNGGGGDGAIVYYLPNTPAQSGTPNTGGGGGGGGNSNDGPVMYYQGGDGGSGIVIFKITLL